MIALFLAALLLPSQEVTPEIAPVVPARTQTDAPFSDRDLEIFRHPDKVYYPQTWFHFIDGNVGREGIKADLEAIAGAGISGIQFFHGGNFGGDWPGQSEHIYCLTEKWDSLVAFTASEAKRLGLRFTMQNCPGWSMAGGPWITPENSMRNLAWTRTLVKAESRKSPQTFSVSVNLPVPEESGIKDADYRDLFVLAFPTPEGERNLFEYDVIPQGQSIETSQGWREFSVRLPQTKTVRSLILNPLQEMNHSKSYEFRTGIEVSARVNGEWKTVLKASFPQTNWQDDGEMTFALDESSSDEYRISISGSSSLNIRKMRLSSAALKNNWEGEAAWTLRGIVRESADPVQDAAAYLKLDSVTDITSFMDADGHLNWNAPEGEWTILRIGHVNTGKTNGPATPEATGYECNKLGVNGPDAHFPAYIGRLADGPVEGKLAGMLLDSWECCRQTWTRDMEDDFHRIAGYDLRQWIPAVLGYVIGDQRTTSRFLNDWRRTIDELVTENFYGRMAQHAAEKGLNIVYETAGGDVFPSDPLRYLKYADEPMCEFWMSGDTSGYVGSLNFKPARPTASAARMYGKQRVGAEAFTSFELTWDEKLRNLKDNANFHFGQGVTHCIFHTYTHNPNADIYYPGTSFGSGIGTPFLRKQTWWKYMPEFTGYLARCAFMLERGCSVSDVLWYLGDEIDHKPDQKSHFPEGYNYDYCNTDVLLNRISVRDGRLVTPEGLEFTFLWIPESTRMLPATLKKLYELIQAGAVVVSDAPQECASIAGADEFPALVEAIWGAGVDLGAGQVITGITIDAAVERFCSGRDVDIQPQSGNKNVVWMHRRAENADWYFIAAPRMDTFAGSVDFRCAGSVELWNPVTGESVPVTAKVSGGRTAVDFDLDRGECWFVVLRHDASQKVVPEARIASAEYIPSGWEISFPEGWGAPSRASIGELRAWKDLGFGPEASAFSGTAEYSAKVTLPSLEKGARYVLNLGRVEMIAEVTVNGQKFRPVWCEPYQVDVTDAVRRGENELVISVTGTWFNRLRYDASLPEAERKTWTISGPSAEEQPRESGLLGPVVLVKESSGR